jgi:hypothetical protein
MNCFEIRNKNLCQDFCVDEFNKKINSCIECKYKNTNSYFIKHETLKNETLKNERLKNETLKNETLKN